MTWSELHDSLREYGVLPDGSAAASGTAQLVVKGVAYDSRQVQPGQVFVALRGQRANGAEFVEQALERGAVIVVSGEPEPDVVGAPWVRVTDPRLALAVLAAAFNHNPSHRMQVVGITGTNGKTTTCYLLASMFEAAGIRCGILGTVGYGVGTDMREAARTTPEAPEVQGLLRWMLDDGCGACVMEVSSHALALRRVDGVRFAAAVFTNLTRDHLDFHADMEEYFQAKRRLFQMLPQDRPAVINADDPRAPSLIETAGRSIRYAINRPADVTPSAHAYTIEGLSFEVRTPRGPVRVRSTLVGRPNVYNILAAVATGVALDLPIGAIERGISTLQSVPGRFQMASTSEDDITVVVDYAHTDDALRNLLETARPLTRGRIVTVFGCGGDRDRTKRPLMGAVAGRLSDVIVITSDNPRSEDPARIIEEVRRGITPDTRRDSAQAVLACVDRGEAVERAIALAKPGDLVLLAGKGHEKTQVIGDETLPFDDVSAAAAALGRRRMRRAG
jgi:UDP-N-acetylmuramoyl-L-alanyl-D-glutamate--2,6-diaminopimelate ligase